MLELAVWLLILPDGKIVLQRRSRDAPVAPGRLALFGGHVELNDTPEQAAWRELKEETSLVIDKKDAKYVLDMYFADDDSTFYVYKAQIQDDSFAVYEGDGAESYAIDEVLIMDDVTSKTKQLLIKVGKDI